VGSALLLIRLFMLSMSFMVQNHPEGFLINFTVQRLIRFAFVVTRAA